METEIAFRRIGSGRRVPRGGSSILAYEQQEIYGELLPSGWGILVCKSHTKLDRIESSLGYELAKTERHFWAVVLGVAWGAS